MTDYTDIKLSYGKTNKTLKAKEGTNFNVGNKNYTVKNNKVIDLKTHKAVSSITGNEDDIEDLITRAGMSTKDGQGVLSYEDMEPAKPKSKTKNYVVGTGDSLGYLAGKNHVTKAQILALNPEITNEDMIKEGQTIKLPYISDEEYENYEKKCTEYNLKYYEATNKAKATRELNKKIDTANSLISKAKTQDYAKNYKFTVDKTNGNIIITLNKEMKLEDIRDNFNIPEGALVQDNPKIKTKYKPEAERSFFNWRSVVDYDNAKIPKGETLIIKVDNFSPEQD